MLKLGGPRLGRDLGKRATNASSVLQEGQVGMAAGSGLGCGPKRMGEPVNIRTRSRLRMAAGWQYP